MIDRLTLRDLDAAHALSASEDWNQTPEDWRRLIELAPDGCFAARDGGRLTGTVTAIVYGDRLAWIGMMVIGPANRGRGIGGSLMRRALEHLHERGVKTIMLDATPAGRPLYQSLVFLAEEEFERWQGVAGGGADHPERVRHATLEEVCALDRAAYGVDRSPVLARLFVEGACEPLGIVDASGATTGFALARAGRNAIYLGPIIAPDDAAASTLLDALLARFAGSVVCLDRRRKGSLTAKALTTRGLALRRGLLRMTHGVRTGAALGPAIHASAGPELG